jgi:hypothetical protein
LKGLSDSFWRIPAEQRKRPRKPMVPSRLAHTSRLVPEVNRNIVQSQTPREKLPLRTASEIIGRNRIAANAEYQKKAHGRLSVGVAPPEFNVRYLCALS